MSDISEQVDRDLGSLDRARRARTLRRAGVALLAVIVLLAATNMLGPRERTVSASAGGLEVTVVHPSVVRPGVEIDVRLRIAGSPAAEVSLTADSTLFEEAGIEVIVPEPREQRAADDRVRLVFDAADGPETTLLLTGRLPTQAPPGRLRIGLEVVRGSGAEPVELELPMWVLP